MNKLKSFVSIVFAVLIAGDLFLGGHFIVTPTIMVISGYGLSDTFWGCSDWLWNGPEGNSTCRDDW